MTRPETGETGAHAGGDGMAYDCRIKLCGLRTEADVRLAVDLGVDRIGFVLTESPRRIDPETCRRLRASVPAPVRVHGLFTTEPAETVCRLMDACGLDVAQVHGREDDNAFWEALGETETMRAFRVRGPETLETLGPVRGGAFLLDAYVPGVPGGTGERFDWDLARRAAVYGRVVLAGGLTPENVGEAIRVARPWMVDVSGGIEARRGVKDPGRMRAFVAAVRETVRSLRGPGATGKPYATRGEGERS